MKRHCLSTLIRMCVSLALLIPHGTPATVLYGQSAAATKVPFSLAYIPRDAVAVFAARPGELLASEVLAQSRGAIDEALTATTGTTVKATDIVEGMMILVPTLSQVSPAFILRFRSRQALSQLTAALGSRDQQSSFGERRYDTWSSGVCSFQPDDTTIVFSPDEVTLRRCIAAGEAGASTTKWAAKWKPVASGDAAVVVNTSLLRGPLSGRIRDTLQQQVPRGRALSNLADPQLLFQLSPLWQRSEHVVAELSLSEKFELTVVSHSASVDEANAVHSALLTALSIGRTALSTARASIAERGDDHALALLQPVEMLDQMLEKARVVQQDGQVGLLLRADHETAQRLAKLAAPAALAGRSATLRTRSMNNLKQIALAFHNYHDTYKRFPAATQIGPKDVPHSWRISLLPFLDQVPLYEQYRQDEPWDSEHNKQLLEKMPEVFRCPLDAAGSTSTSYVTFVGAEGVRPSPAFVAHEPPRIASFTDGTTNVILVVETKERSIPWTKPADLPFDPDAPLADLGGWYPDGFNVAMCDGSVRMIPQEIDEQTLRRAILRDDGNPLSLP